MKFSQICHILGCPTNVKAGEPVSRDLLITCEELEAEMIWEAANYEDELEFEELMDKWEYEHDYDY